MIKDAGRAERVETRKDLDGRLEGVEADGALEIVLHLVDCFLQKFWIGQSFLIKLELGCVFLLVVTGTVRIIKIIIVFLAEIVITVLFNVLWRDLAFGVNLFAS